MALAIYRKPFLTGRIVLITLLTIISLPIFSLLSYWFRETSSYLEYFKENLVLEYLTNTLILILGTSFTCLILGIFTAWIVVKHDFPGKKYFEIAFIIPLAIPVYIQAYTYAGLFDYGGVFQTTLSYFSIRHIDIMNIWGLIFVYSSVLFPYVYLMVRSSFLLQSNRIEKAGFTLSKNKWTTLSRLIIPLSWPAIFGAITLVVIEVLNDYGAVKYFGVNTFVVGIFRSWFGMGDIGAAMYQSFLLILIVGGVLLIETIANRKKKYHSKQGEPIAKNPVKFGSKTTIVVLILCSLIVLFSLLLPMGQQLYWASINSELFSDSSYLSALLNSLGVALCIASLVAIIAFIAVFLMTIIKKKSYKTLLKFSLLTYFLPGAILAISVIIFVTQIDSLFNIQIISSTTIFGGSTIVLCFAYFIRFYGVAHNSLATINDKLPNTYLNTAFSLGKNVGGVFLKIYSALMRPAFFSTFLLVFIDVIKELPLMLILRPFNFDTLATMAYQSANDELTDQSSVYALTILLLSIVPTVYLIRSTKNN
tara:strand:- start:2971 stop:4575 length:1605 start_codon:yes stop_codon:yes gene_type:complete